MNASEAARRAGYAPKSAGEYGSWLLKKPHIREAVERLVFDRAQLTRAEIITELRDVALSNIDDLLSWDQPEELRTVLEDGTTVITQRARVQLRPSKELTRRQKAAIKSVTEKTSADGSSRVEITQHDKLAALDKLARIFDLFPRDGETRVNIGFNAPVTSVSVSYADDPATIDGEASDVTDNDR